MAMFPFRHSDGNWYNEPEPRPQPLQLEPKPSKPWTPQGFFKDSRPMSRRLVKAKAEDARDWLFATLYAGAKPATEVLRLARREGINEWSLRRAKRYHKVRSVKHGWTSPWLWQFPATTHS